MTTSPPYPAPYPPGPPPLPPRGNGYRTTTLLALAAAVIAGIVALALFFTMPSSDGSSQADGPIAPDPALVKRATEIVCLPFTLSAATFDADFQRAEAVLTGAAKRLYSSQRDGFESLAKDNSGITFGCSVTALGVISAGDEKADLVATLRSTTQGPGTPTTINRKFEMVNQNGQWLISEMTIAGVN
ncbi:hypothetical protein MUG78_02460 [Gordonia alkaliphila]|uniref:Mce-associated membrane protein n=1 Tax=Gordonia alkaliphila TaxID=1053547 RepID=A0ABP8ZD49_9ACTN|nr:hypothetical protein [Gordonia alkaliphila]MCK0438353.1 hypothetical protein [Gordonia alkaliphila]